MKTARKEFPFAIRESMDELHIEATEFTWKPLYKVGAVAALVMVAFIPIQVIIFLAWPPPKTVSGYFTLFQHNWLLGLLSLDLLYLVDNALLILMYLAIYATIRRANQALMALSLTLGLVGIATYYASNVAFEMLSLSNQYAAATTEAQRSMFLAAGQVMLASYTGTAFDVYYVLNAIATLMISGVMLRNTIFGKGTASVGIVTGVLMLVPSTAGTIGLVFSLMSLVPCAIWFVLIACKLFILAQGIAKEEAKRPTVA